MKMYKFIFLFLAMTLICKLENCFAEDINVTATISENLQGEPILALTMTNKSSEKKYLYYGENPSLNGIDGIRLFAYKDGLNEKPLTQLFGFSHRLPPHPSLKGYEILSEKNWTIDLKSRFPDLLKIRANNEIVLFWTHRIGIIESEDKSKINDRRFGGMLVIPSKNKTR